MTDEEVGAQAAQRLLAYVPALALPGEQLEEVASDLAGGVPRVGRVAVGGEVVLEVRQDASHHGNPTVTAQLRPRRSPASAVAGRVGATLNATAPPRRPGCAERRP